MACGPVCGTYFVVTPEPAWGVVKATLDDIVGGVAVAVPRFTKSNVPNIRAYVNGNGAPPHSSLRNDMGQMLLLKLGFTINLRIGMHGPIVFAYENGQSLTPEACAALEQCITENCYETM